jgi:hypothetical protein
MDILPVQPRRERAQGLQFAGGCTVKEDKFCGSAPGCE